MDMGIFHLEIKVVLIVPHLNYSVWFVLFKSKNKILTFKYLLWGMGNYGWMSPHHHFLEVSIRSKHVPQFLRGTSSIVKKSQIWFCNNEFIFCMLLEINSRQISYILVLMAGYASKNPTKLRLSYMKSKLSWCLSVKIPWPKNCF